MMVSLCNFADLLLALWMMQLLFCEDGLASSEEQEKLKVMATYQNFGF